LASRFHVRSCNWWKVRSMRSSPSCRHLGYLVSANAAQTEGDNVASPSFIYKPGKRPRGRRAAYARNAIVLATTSMASLVVAGRDAGDAVGGFRCNRFRQDHASEEHHHPGPVPSTRPPEDQHRTPMLIFDGKGDQDFSPTFCRPSKPRPDAPTESAQPLAARHLRSL